MTRSWTIGSGPDCDLVVNLPKVSGRHCRLSREGDGYVLEDLGSTNGTYLDGVRIDGRVRVRPGDAVTLGVAAPMPWPTGEPEPDGVVLRIGRKPDNDLVVDQPCVSDYHARIIREGEREGGGAIIEDLGSASGTALGSVDRKISRAALTATDMIYLGTHGVPAASLLARLSPAPVPTLAFRGDALVIGRAPDCNLVLDLPMVSGHHARLERSEDRLWIEDLGSANGTYVNGQRVSGRVAVAAGDAIGLGSYGLVLAIEMPDEAVRDASATIDASPATSTSTGTERSLRPSWGLAVLLVQAPLVAILIALALSMERPGPSGPEGSGGVSRAAAGSLYWLGLAAIWFGLSGAVLGTGLVATRSGKRPAPEGIATLGRRSLIPGVLAVGQCALAWVLVVLLAGLRGPALPILAFLILASIAGLALGLLIVAAAPGPRSAPGLLAVVVLALGLLGGGPWPLARMPSPVRMLACAAPTRWTFEGLLLLASGRAPGPEAGAGRGRGPVEVADAAEEAFPAGSERMGLRADAMALALLAIGMTAVAGFIAHERGRPS